MPPSRPSELIQEAQARTEAFGPADPYDLVIRGGEVVDPSQNLRGRRDVGVRNAMIAAIEPEFRRRAAGRRSTPRGSLSCRD